MQFSLLIGLGCARRASVAQSPPGFVPIVTSPPPPRWPFHPSLPPPPSNARPSSTQGRILAGLLIGVVACLIVFTAVCTLCREYRDRRARAAAAAWRWPVPERNGVRVVGERQLGRAYAASPTAGLPAFTYSPSVKRNMTGGGEEEAATCSVCLGALQLGETVRLLPACLHMYHAECIDPWLDAHSTCPVCRSDTGPAAGVGRPPSV
ncbi:RING-H2 finger protein ATL43-like [Triticum aestivum]|uniref:RING-H2 finger protein ATL43-like n=1 Tax=Triticum aestivum TaxID=4565 RepID=UPI001D0025B0|nr:RING-H2 finger protein ATL43-like [Triticum aestivum]